MKVKSYKLNFDFDLEKKTFNAHEEIFLELNNKKSKIFLDCNELNIKNVLVNDEKSSWKLNEQKLVINNRFNKGLNKIIIDFGGDLKESLGGVYLSKYYDDKNNLNYLITTQLEPIEARRFFPCFDHPNLKSVFEISLTIDKNLNAISNTLPIKEENFVSKKKIVFKPTPVMSTYLVYLGVGKWHFLQEKYKKVILRLATLNKKNLSGGYFALKNAKKFLSYLQNYFDYPYPLEKLDLIAIPDFAAGAMENWGAITFRENLLLAFEKITSLSARERILEVIAHELVHMWFGNLVTMKWWDDLWLNESFATYLAYEVVDHFYPHWRLKERYVIDETISALIHDGLINSHPVKVKVLKPEETLEIFDEISYEKGGSILRMVENYIGQNKFKESLRYYIRKFAYKNATHKDLFLSFDKISGKSITKVIETFIKQSNFPLIRVIPKRKKIILNQERFTFLANNSNYLWKIPLVIGIDDQKKNMILSKKKINLKLSFKKHFILNKDFIGFYLVDYPQEIIDKNLQELNFMSELDIVHFIRSYDFLIRRKNKSLINFLNFLEKILVLNRKKLILSEVISILNFYYFILGTESLAKLLERFSLKAIELVGYKPQNAKETPQMTLLRSKALISLGLVNNQKILDFSQKEFQNFLKNGFSLNSDIKQAVFNNAVLVNDKFFDKILQYFYRVKIIEEQNKSLIALGQTTNLDRINYLLNLTISDKIRFNQIIFIFASLSNNRLAAELIFNWLKKNWQKLEKKGGGAGKSDFVLMKILKLTIPSIGTFIDEENLNNFLNSKSFSRFKRTKKVVLEIAKVSRQIRWKELLFLTNLKV